MLLNKKDKPILYVVKRDRRIIPFDEEKIVEDIYCAVVSIGTITVLAQNNVQSVFMES